MGRWKGLLFVGFCLLSLNCYSQIKLNITAFNPSREEAQEVDVCQELPPEFAPEDVIDSGELEINYDVRKSVYCVEKKKVDLKPQELSKFIVEVSDVWRLKEKELGFIRQYTQGLVDLLAGSAVEEIGKELGEDIKTQLDKIIARQEEGLLTIRERRENYRQSLDSLAKINKEIASLELIAVNKGVVPQEFIEQSKFLAGLGEEEFFLDKEELEAVKLSLKINNPADSKKEKFAFVYYLPREIKPDDVLQKEDLELKYDLAEKLFYLCKDLDLEPQENKVYKVELKDVWKIDLEKLNIFSDYGQKMADLLKGGGDYSLGLELRDDIIDSIAGIIASQNREQSLEMQIGAFRDNLKRIEKIKDDIRKSEKLALKIEAGGRQAGKLLKQTYRSLFGIIPLPSAQTAFRMIWAVIIFLGIFGGLFFIIQYVQTKKVSK
ncbi:MAG: hypothetical protein KKC11_01315 [Candidatus Omnitrophica bacterium]|nr:hypothetical protein [Candidatus Omnitrophota bacterium]